MYIILFLDSDSFLLMGSFSLIFARGKHFVVAYEMSSGLLKVWDIDEAIRNPTPNVTVTLPSPCWSIQMGGELFRLNTTVHLIHSAHKDYQIIVFGSNGNKVDI